MTTVLRLAQAAAEPRPLLLLRRAALQGVGPDVAGQLPSSTGDNSDRLRFEAAFAHLCGVAPIPASSGRTHSHVDMRRH